MAKTRRLPMTAGNILASLETRKTVTRRIVRPQPTPELVDGCACHVWRPRKGIQVYRWPNRPKTAMRDYCPYGKPGDNLALTETWRPVEILHVNGVLCVRIEYRANSAVLRYKIPDEAATKRMYAAILHGKWMPPMFMQAWASRASAVVKSIRVERVQEITDADAIAEGVVTDEKYADWPDEHLCACPKCDGRGVYETAYAPDYGVTEVDCESCATPQKRFRILWDSINEKRGHGWDVNDWVWAVEYELTST